MEATTDPAPSPTPVVLRGSCSCGQVTFTSGTLPIAVTVCHCVTCRKLSGNPYLTFGLYHNSALMWSGDITVTASELAFRGSCRSCHTPLYMKYHCRPDGTSVTMGLIDNSSTVSDIPDPKEHIFLSDKAAWVRLPISKTELHMRFNESFQRRLEEWIAWGKPERRDMDLVNVDACRWIFGGRPQIGAWANGTDHELGQD